MRREFIIVLLSIISISTLSSLLSDYVHVESDKVLLDTVNGAVGAGNFSYWQLGHNGPLLVGLTSITGDADLYVSDTVRPSYEVDKNNFSSVTCGADIVHIPADFPRPIGIGVFGHWSHHVSQYSIQVFLDGQMLVEGISLRDRAHQEMERRKEKPAARKTEEESKGGRVLRLLGILDMIFEMFVL